MPREASQDGQLFFIILASLIFPSSHVYSVYIHEKVRDTTLSACGDVDVYIEKIQSRLPRLPRANHDNFLSTIFKELLSSDCMHFCRRIRQIKDEWTHSGGHLEVSDLLSQALTSYNNLVQSGEFRQNSKKEHQEYTQALLASMMEDHVLPILVASRDSDRSYNQKPDNQRSRDPIPPKWLWKHIPPKVMTEQRDFAGSTFQYSTEYRQWLRTTKVDKGEAKPPLPKRKTPPGKPKQQPSKKKPAPKGSHPETNSGDEFQSKIRDFRSYLSTFGRSSDNIESNNQKERGSR